MNSKDSHNIYTSNGNDLKRYVAIACIQVMEVRLKLQKMIALKLSVKDLTTTGVLRSDDH